MLTDRQKLTLEHLKEKGITSAEDIIKYCLTKIPQPRSVSYTKHFNAPRTKRRRHSKNYYHEIIYYFAKG